jgi:hypothetical protein
MSVLIRVSYLYIKEATRKVIIDGNIHSSLFISAVAN